MTLTSPLLRIVSGIVLIGFSYLSYGKNKEHIASGKPLEVLGLTTAASPDLLTAAFAAIALVGVVFLILGTTGLFTKRG